MDILKCHFGNKSLISQFINLVMEFVFFKPYSLRISFILFCVMSADDLIT